MSDKRNTTRLASAGEADGFDAAELAMVDTLKAKLPIDPVGFDARVMAAVRLEPKHGGHSPRRRSSFWMPAISAGGVALAAAVVFLSIRSELPVNRQPAVPTIVRSQPAAHTVRFTLVASGASHVVVAGSFNGWNTTATPLRKVDNDTWAADVPLGAGRYVYQFVIDGARWVPDPRAPHDAGDDFGATNSVVTVAGSGSA
jgi:hypothetical protein